MHTIAIPVATTRPFSSVGSVILSIRNNVSAVIIDPHFEVCRLLLLVLLNNIFQLLTMDTFI